MVVAYDFAGVAYEFCGGLWLRTNVSWRLTTAYDDGFGI